MTRTPSQAPVPATAPAPAREPLSDPGISEAAYEAADQAGLTRVPVRPGLLGAARQAHRSDDWVFRDAGVTAVHFSTGPHDDYPGDTPDKVSRVQVSRIARFLRAHVERTAR